MSDEIIDELWAIKDAIAKEAEYNVDKLVERLRQRQMEGKCGVVNFSEQQGSNRAAQA